MAEYKYYMRKYGTADDDAVPIIDLESHFDGMIVRSVSGLSSVGTPKNIYTETYAEDSEVRVYLPETVERESTQVTIRASFRTTGRRSVYEAFCNYIIGSKIKYWDTVRNRLVYLLLDSAIELEEDFLFGSDPFLTVEFRFMNLFGRSYTVE